MSTIRANVLRRATIATLLFGVMACWSAPGWASCGALFAQGADPKRLESDATRVVLMREGDLTVQSMQLTYSGAPEVFLMVVPVPVVLKREQVQTLPHHAFEALDRLSAPRHVHVWERDPCWKGVFGDALSKRAPTPEPDVVSGPKPVTVAARFAVGEYDVVVLSARESSGLVEWLRARRYSVPAEAARALKPYVQQGMYFFVARINLKKLQRDARGRYTLSPLRFHYHADALTLPVRLGTLNASGPQDLIVTVLTRAARVEVANAPNVAIPTNLKVRGRARDQLGSFYAALFDRVVRERPGAAVLEFAGCARCGPERLSLAALALLGGDLTRGLVVSPLRFASSVTLRAGVERAEGTSARDASRIARAYAEGLRACHAARVSGATRASEDEIEARATFDADGRPLALEIPASARARHPMQTLCLEQLHQRARAPRRAPGAQTWVRFTLSLRVRPEPQTVWAPPNTWPHWMITRVHMRLLPGARQDDLVFRTAAPIQGGHGLPSGPRARLAPTTSANVKTSRFQARYVTTRAWRPKLRCADARRGSWGAPRHPDARRTPDHAAPLRWDHHVKAAPDLKPFLAQTRVPGIRSLTTTTTRSTQR